MFAKMAKRKVWEKMLFTIVIAFAVVAFWRGVWGLLEIYLFPSDRALSLWASVALGLAILLATHYTTKELM